MAKPFPSFRLPRELRDRVYAEVGGKSERHDIECRTDEPNIDDGDDSSNDSGLFTFDVRATAFCTPVANLRLISHTFKAECEMEIHRHSVLLVTILRDDDFLYRPKQLVKGGRAHRSFRSIPNLEIQLYDKYTRSNPVLGDYEVILDTFLPFLDNLESIDYKFLFYSHGKTNGTDSASPAPLKDILDRNGPLWHSQKLAVHITNHIYLKSPLFCVNEPFQPTSREHGRYPFFYEFMSDSSIRSLITDHRYNQITYSATSSAEEGQFWGLDLTVYEAVATIDFADVVQDAEAEYDDMLHEGEQRGHGYDDYYDDYSDGDYAGLYQSDEYDGRSYSYVFDEDEGEGKGD